jgi:hypothetical protein
MYEAEWRKNGWSTQTVPINPVNQSWRTIFGIIIIMMMMMVIAFRIGTKRSAALWDDESLTESLTGSLLRGIS